MFEWISYSSFSLVCCQVIQACQPFARLVTFLHLLKLWPLRASSSPSGCHQVCFIMVIFYDSSRTLNDQSITLLRPTNKPLEKGIILKVHPLGSSISSSLSTAIPHPPSLSQWWVEASHELHDPTRKDLHVTSRTFTLASNLHSTVDHVDPFPLLGRRISAGEVQWGLPSSKTPHSTIGVSFLTSLNIGNG